MTSKFPLFLLVLLICSLVSAHATGTTRSFTLFGSFQGGWGFTANNITSPGPMIMVEQGDTVNLTLISNDGIQHQFFVSYANDSTEIRPGDPEIHFSGTANFCFNSTNTIGTYRYLCYVDFCNGNRLMWGYFKVVPTGTIPELQPLAMLLLFILSVGIAVLARKKPK